MAVNLLLARTQGRRRLERLPPGVTAYVFDGIRDVEILRRLTQMPDETPLDMMEMSSLVVVNDPATPLKEHLHRLQMIMYYV